MAQLRESCTPWMAIRTETTHESTSSMDTAMHATPRTATKTACESALLTDLASPTFKFTDRNSRLHCVEVTDL